MVLLYQDIYTILNVVLNYNTKWQSRTLILDYEGKHDDEIYLHFINKKIPDFWKSWSNKLKNKVYTNVQINSLTNNRSIANCLVIILLPYMLTPLII